MTPGEEIKKIRESVNMNRAEFSRLTGIPTRTLQNWENDERIPPEYMTRLLMYAVYVNQTLGTDISKTDLDFLKQYMKIKKPTETVTYTVNDPRIGNLEIEVIHRNTKNRI